MYVEYVQHQFAASLVYIRCCLKSPPVSACSFGRQTCNGPSKNATDQCT